MSGLELVVRRDGAPFSTSYHVTVAAVGPVSTLEAFDVQNRHGLAAATDEAMNRLRAQGYRMTAPVAFHGYYATARLTRDGREPATIELGADLVADARAVVRALSGIGTREGAEEVARLIAALVAGAQALQARADAVLASDASVVSAALLDDAMSHLDGGVS